MEKETGDEVLSMDIDIKHVVASRTYYYGSAAINGVVVNEMLVDKISTCSSDSVYKWRTKDMVDVFALSQCVKINLRDIYDISQKANRKILSFDAFYNQKDKVEYSYNKLKGITGL